MRTCTSLVGILLMALPAIAQPMPTAGEIFELRSKCQQLTEQLAKEKEAGLIGLNGLTVDAISNLNIQDVRCYGTFKLEWMSTDINPGKPPIQMSVVHLYDINTRELMAATRKSGQYEDGNIFDETHELSSRAMVEKSPTERLQITTEFIKQVMDPKRYR